MHETGDESRNDERSRVRIPVALDDRLVSPVINLVAYVDRVNLSVATPLVMQEFGLDAVQMGAIMSVFYVGYGIMNTPGGMLADKYSARLTILAGLFGWSVFTWITGTAASFAQFMLIRFGFGLGEGVLAPGNSRLVYNWFKPNERATANALLAWRDAAGRRGRRTAERLGGQRVWLARGLLRVRLVGVILTAAHVLPAQRAPRAASVHLRRPNARRSPPPSRPSPHASAADTCRCGRCCGTPGCGCSAAPISAC